MIDKGDDKWKNVWKAGVLELFQNPEYSVNSINSLLKVIERAFKERTYTIRAQAFECWQFFITKVELHVASEKLLNVILIPLCASNHSVFIVLQSKLKTWLTLLNTSLIAKPILKEKGIPNLLRILYGPHSLPTASSCDELLELCGTIYSTLVQKCLPHDETNIILSYLEKAIPCLSRSEGTQVMARKIWTSVVDRVSFNKWPATHFGYLMKAFENLLSDNNERSNALASELLSYLICEYNSIPVDCLMPHLNLVTRCLFHSSVNDLSLTNTIEALLKKFRKKENFFFDEVKKTLTEFSEDYKNKLQKCWIIVVSCFCKWMKENANSVYENCEWILLFPVKHLHDKWNAEITEQMQQCYEIISAAVGNDNFVCNLCRKLMIILNKSENVPVSLLNGATCLCKIILQKCKPSDEISSIRHVLITIFQKMPSQVSADDIQKIFIPKYLSCVLYFVECYPDYGQDFSAIIRKYSQCIDVENEGKELPVVQLISKYNSMQNENSENNPSVLKVCNGVNMLTGDKITPAKSKIRSSFLSRLSPAEKKPVLMESPSVARSVRTPKSSQKSKLNDDDDVQFITVLPKPKNSPMTEHQKEMAKAKSYIPALYEDLSQSQSQSDSLSSFSSRKDQPVINVSSDYFEENANLPSINSATDSAEEVPSSFNFHKTIKSGKLTKTFSSKKSLFNDVDLANQHPSYNLSNNLEKKENNLNTEDSSTENHDILFNTSTNDEQLSTTRSKRKSSRIECKTPEPEPLKRSKVSSSAVSSDSKPSNRKKGRPRKSILGKKEESPTKRDTEVVNMIDSESQNLFVTKTPIREVNRNVTASSPAPLLLTVKNSSTVDKNTRRRSLRSKNTNDLTRQSPIATRKRKSLSADTVESKKNMYAKSDEIKINSDLSHQNLIEGTNSVNKVEVEVRTTENTQPCQTTEKHSEEVSYKESSFPSSTVIVLHSGTKITADSEKVSPPKNIMSCCEKSSSTSFATVDLNSEKKVPYNSDEISLKNTDSIIKTDTRESSLISDSVIIIEDEKEYDVIIINDSQSQSESNVKQADVHETCSLNETENAKVQTDTKIDIEVKDPEDDSTFFENTQITSGSQVNNKHVIETVPSEANKSLLSADMFGVSESRCENSFKLNQPQDDNTNENKIDVPANEAIDLISAESSNRFENGSITKNIDGNSALKVGLIAEEQIDNLASTTPYENKSVSTAIEESFEKHSVLATENMIVTVSKPSEESDQEKFEDKSRETPSTDMSSAVTDKSVGGSPISNNTRTSQMLKMVFGAQVVTNQRGRGKIQSNRNSLGGINSTCTNNSVVSSRITTNSRTMKMLQVNGHKESPVRPSPNKKIAVSTEKIERLTYVPKDCTSPGILKKPNLSSTLSPRSPKSVNFAEILTDTREYQIDDDNNFSDSWTSFDNEFSNNLLSDEEGTSQETLYSPLHNCSDDIKYLVERLSLNQKQLDTFRRMGIETVGQLASASTIVGKSIPVGDNRLNRLRNALKAYDNDRKLKGLRAPSVRRKIVYKSQNKKLEVGSIIEILDDVDEFDPEVPAPESESVEKMSQICQPTVKIIKVEDDETCTYVLSKNLSFTSVNSSSGSLALTQEKSSRNEVVEPDNINESLVESKDEVEKEVINAKVADIEPSGNTESTLSKIQISPVRVQVERVSLPYSPSMLQSSPSKKQQSPSKGQQYHLTEKQSSSPKRKLFPDEEGLSPTKRLLFSKEEEKTYKEPPSFIKDLSISSPTDMPMMMEMNTITESSDHIVDIVDIAQSVVEKDKNDISVVPNEDNVECKSSTTELESKDADVNDLELKMDNNSAKSTVTDEVNVEFVTDTKMSVELKSSDDKSTESITDNDVDEDVDFICTDNDDFIGKNDNLRTYSRLVKARLSMALLHSEDNVTSEIRGPTSPEIICVEVVNSRISEPVDKEKSISNFSEKKDNSINEEHSMSIFSPDMTKDNVNLALDSASQSLIDVSRYISESPNIKCNVEIQKTGNNNANDDIVDVNDDEASKQEEMMTLSQWDGQKDVSTSKNSQRKNLFQRLVRRTLEPYIGPAGARRYTVTEDEAEELFKEMVDGLCVELEDLPMVQLKETTKTRLKNILNSLSSSSNS